MDLVAERNSHRPPCAALPDCERRNAPKADRCVLLVEDDDIMRMSLVDRLRLAGVRVAGCATAGQAQQMLARCQFAMMVTDIRLPDLSGAELFDRVRAIAPEIPVVFMTGYATVSDAVRLMRAGAFDYLEKPFDPADLVDAVHHVFEAMGKSGDGRISLREAVAGTEKTVIVEMLEQHGHSMTRTAEALGISRKNLWEKMRRYAIEK